jgi:Ca2+-binding RTX toxin-like protein
MYPVVTGYVETMRSTGEEALAFAKTQWAAGSNYVAVAWGGSVTLYVHPAGPYSSSDTNYYEVTLNGRGLNDISSANVGGSGNDAPPTPQPPAPTGVPASGPLSFETASGGSALTILPSDTLTFGSGTATGIAVAYNGDSITLTMNGMSKAFGNSISDVSKAGHISMPDGSKLFIGLTGSENFTGATTGDAAFGGQGDDTLDGGAGGDLLQGNQGADSLAGGEGNDTVYGGQDGDNLQMGQGGNFGQGNRGEDVIVAGEGIDTLLGGQDNDTVSGGGGNDFLNGNRGDDSINGGDGADTLYGEGGSDTLMGGLGADIFHGFADGGLDRILDFSRAEGDRIVLDPGTVYTATQSGGDVVVAYGADQIVIVGASLAALTGDWITA